MSDSNCINRSKIDGIELRQTLFEDLKEINDLLAQVDFDTGVHILELYYLHSDRRWLVAVDEKTGEIVAFDSAHILPVNGIVFGFEMHVRKEYQNRGIIKAIGCVYEPTPFIGNATAEAVSYISPFEKYDMKLVGYAGIPNLSRLEDDERSDTGDSGQTFATFKISILENPEDMDQMLVYDRSVLDLDRTKFMRAWCARSKGKQPYAKTLIARRDLDGVVVGFGTLRLYSDYYGISPLYADDETVAKRLLMEMVKLLEQDCGEQELYVFFDAKNYLMMKFVHGLKLKRCNTEIRQYRGSEVTKDHMKFEKVYAVHDYWPV